MGKSFDGYLALQYVMCGIEVSEDLMIRMREEYRIDTIEKNKKSKGKTKKNEEIPIIYGIEPVDKDSDMKSFGNIKVDDRYFEIWPDKILYYPTVGEALKLAKGGNIQPATW